MLIHIHFLRNVLKPSQTFYGLCVSIDLQNKTIFDEQECFSILLIALNHA